jgi:hypothetical protein
VDYAADVQLAAKTPSASTVPDVWRAGPRQAEGEARHGELPGIMGVSFGTLGGVPGGAPVLDMQGPSIVALVGTVVAV